MVVAAEPTDLELRDMVVGSTSILERCEGRLTASFMSPPVAPLLEASCVGFDRRLAFIVRLAASSRTSVDLASGKYVIDTSQMSVRATLDTQVFK